MSRTRITLAIGAGAILAGSLSVHSTAFSAHLTLPQGQKQSASGTSSTDNLNPAAIFQEGQEALNAGRLSEAERAFRQVLAINPQVGGAYANLGVVYMRRKQWTKALEMLRKAQALMPQVAGIRLNLGLAYYRQEEYLKAIPEFDAVVRQEPGMAQARHLLGMCYFFAGKWPQAVQALEPLWPQESQNLDYLYVLMISANHASQKELDNRAYDQLLKVGGNSPEFHLFLGKAHLNLGQYDQALAEFQEAAKSDPKLTFVHFNMGLVYLKKEDYSHARDEFLADAAIEPDVALNYDQLGDVYWFMQQDQKAEQSYREAIQRDPRLVDARVGLAKVCEHEGQHAQALAAIDAAEKLDPERTDVHYIRGQVLNHIGRKEESKREFQKAIQLEKKNEGVGGKPTEAPPPSPELLRSEP